MLYNQKMTEGDKTEVLTMKMVKRKRMKLKRDQVMR